MSGIRLSCLIILFFLVRGSTPSHAQERRIQPGDVLQITVLGRPDLSRTVTVRSDGTMLFPFLGEERLTGLSLTQLRILITTRLIPYVEGGRPAVDILWGEEAKAKDAVTVTVLGMVGAPGVFSVASRSGVQGAITAAGGTKVGARRREIKLRRMTDGGPVEISVDIEKFMETGDLEYIPLLQEGDIIIVPGGLTSGAVKVLGAVEKPGTYEPTAGATVFDMLTQAGGVTKSARVSSIRLVRAGAGLSEEYTVNLSEYLQTGKQTDSPAVEPGDIIIVPSKLISYEKVLNFARDLTVLLSLVYLYAILRGAFR